MEIMGWDTMATKTKKSWVVEIRCEIVKELICDDCTEDQAENDPWEHAIDEREVYQEDWSVMSVRENV